MIQICHIVRGIVAAAGKAGRLIRFERIHHRRMHRIFLETTGAGMAVQALGVLESARNTDRRWIRRGAHVLHINALQPLHLVLERAVDGVVLVARITRHVDWYAVVL